MADSLSTASSHLSCPIPFSQWKEPLSLHCQWRGHLPRLGQGQHSGILAIAQTAPLPHRHQCLYPLVQRLCRQDMQYFRSFALAEPLMSFCSGPIKCIFETQSEVQWHHSKPGFWFSSHTGNCMAWNSCLSVQEGTGRTPLSTASESSPSPLPGFLWPPAWWDTPWHVDTTTRVKHLTYLFFKEVSPQLGICGRQSLPQVLVPFSNHVSPPAGLDSGTWVLENVSWWPARVQQSSPCPCGARPREKTAKDRGDLLPLWTGVTTLDLWAATWSSVAVLGPSHLVAHFVLNSWAPSWITLVWYWFFLQRGQVFLFVNSSKAWRHAWRETWHLKFYE